MPLVESGTGLCALNNEISCKKMSFNQKLSVMFMQYNIINSLAGWIYESGVFLMF